MAKKQVIPIKDAFAKGLIDGFGRNKLPTNFAQYIRNARIENKAMSIRLWSQTVVEDATGTHIRWISSNSTYNKIICASNSRLKSVNLTTAALVDIGAIGTDAEVSIFNHWAYSIILTWISKPYIYDWTTLTLLTTTSPDVNPIIWETFSWFTVIVGNTTATENFIYFSRPVTPTNPTYAYDWVWSWAESRNMQSKILWVKSSLNNLFIFTENTIEFVGKDSLSSVWGTFSFYSSPIGEWDQLLNANCIVTANDKVFYMTKDFTIKSVNYVQGTIDPAIGQLSDRPLLSIKNFLWTQLNATNTTAFAIRKEDKVERHVRSYDSTLNNLVVVYDITNDSRLIDDDKYFSCMTKYNSNFYAGSYLNSNIIQDETWNSNDNIWIPFACHTVAVNFGNPLLRKFFKWWILAWMINYDAVINIDTVVDWFVVSTDTIYGSDYSTSAGMWIWSTPIGWTPIGGDLWVQTNALVPFEKINNQWNVNVKWKNIYMKITCNQPNARFYLDYLAYILSPIGNVELGDIL